MRSDSHIEVQRAKANVVANCAIRFGPPLMDTVGIDVREKWGCVTWETDLTQNRRDLLALHKCVSLELCSLL